MTQDNQIVAFDISGRVKPHHASCGTKSVKIRKVTKAKVSQNITTNHPLLMPPDVPLANADKSHTGCADPC